MVFFLDAMEHIARITRMIRQGRGNALLVGVGGTGKQSLTRLASHICGYKCFQIELSRGYNYDSFHEDLKKLYELAGVKNTNTVFLFTDTQVNDSILSVFFTIITTGGGLINLTPFCFDRLTTLTID